MAQLDSSEQLPESAAIAAVVAEKAWLPRIGSFSVRALVVADHDAYLKFGSSLAAEDVRLRFAGPVKRDARLLEDLFSGIDHDRVEVFAAVAEDGEILGLLRIVRIGSDAAETAVIIRSELKRRGLGRLLLDRAARYACSRGLREIRAEILYENRPMLELATKAGFRFVERNGVLAGMSKALNCPPASVRPK